MPVFRCNLVVVVDVSRAGQLKSSGERLSDRVAVGVLTQAFPAGLVDEVLAETGRIRQRNRLLPARLVVDFVLAMCLFSGQSYEEVARLLTMGLQGARSWRASWAVPSTTAIWKVRSRLGVTRLRELFARVCRPVATPGTQGAFYRDWRLSAIDGTTFDLPDTKVNVEAFGRPPCSGRGEQNVGYPQIRMVGLVKCGTHAVFDAAIGALRTGEQVPGREGPVVPAAGDVPAGRPWLLRRGPVVQGRGDRGGPAVACQQRPRAAHGRGVAGRLLPHGDLRPGRHPPHPSRGAGTRGGVRRRRP